MPSHIDPAIHTRADAVDADWGPARRRRMGQVINAASRTTRCLVHPQEVPRGGRHPQRVYSRQRQADNTNQVAATVSPPAHVTSANH